MRAYGAPARVSMMPSPMIMGSISIAQGSGVGRLRAGGAGASRVSSRSGSPKRGGRKTETAWSASTASPGSTTTVVPPILTTVPQSTMVAATGTSATVVPLAEPSSWTTGREPSSMRAWRWETSGSLSCSVQPGARPTVACEAPTRTRRPRSGPSRTRRTARERAGPPGRWRHDCGAWRTSTRSPVRSPHSVSSRSAGHSWRPSVRHEAQVGAGRGPGGGPAPRPGRPRWPPTWPGRTRRPRAGRYSGCGRTEGSRSASVAASSRALGRRVASSGRTGGIRRRPAPAPGPGC